MKVFTLISAFIIGVLIKEHNQIRLKTSEPDAKQTTQTGEAANQQKVFKENQGEKQAADIKSQIAQANALPKANGDQANPASTTPNKPSITPTDKVEPTTQVPQKPNDNPSTSSQEQAKPLVTNTKVFPNQNNSTNAVGKIVPESNSVSSPPYTVKSCDQVLLINAKTILDDNDYADKREAFFTMNVYMLNLFEKPDNSKLLNSLYLHSITRVPQVIKGTKDCLGFFNDLNKRGIYLCYERTQEIVDAFNAFSKCRQGHNLSSDTEEKLKRVVGRKSCLKLINKKKEKGDSKYGKWKPRKITKVPGSK